MSVTISRRPLAAKRLSTKLFQQRLLSLFVVKLFGDLVDLFLKPFCHFVFLVCQRKVPLLR